MPKLIIKREIPQRFTWQAILFWVLGLLPVVLLAGFLTGNLVSQLTKPDFEAGRAPLVPLAPIEPIPELPSSQAPTLPLPALSETPALAPSNPPLIIESGTLTPEKESTKAKPAAKASSETAAVKPTAPRPQTSKNVDKSTSSKPVSKPDNEAKSNPHKQRLITNNQQNDRSRPAPTPSTIHKPIKSPQIVRESRRAVSRPIASKKTEARSKPVAHASTAPTTRPVSRAGNDDYRLLEQSLGIPLQ